MPLSLQQTQAIGELAQFLYPFLPGKAHPYADQSISFAGVGNALGLSQFWAGGSKQPAISRLLASTLEHRPNQFCPLILEIVRRGIIYRQVKNPVTKEEVEELNDFVKRAGFKIPELWDSQFLSGLPRSHASETQEAHALSEALRSELINDLIALSSISPQPRGLKFEKLLNDIFEAFQLAPRAAFRLVGEQIDGSLQFQGETYLVEAKWHNHRIGQQELLVFSGKVSGKAQWSRGLLISYSGFTQDGLDAFTRGKPTNIVCLDGLDLHYVFQNKLNLQVVLERKARRAAETNEAYVSVRELFP